MLIYLCDSEGMLNVGSFLTWFADKKNLNCVRFSDF